MIIWTEEVCPAQTRVDYPCLARIHIYGALTQIQATKHILIYD